MGILIIELLRSLGVAALNNYVNNAELAKWLNLAADLGEAGLEGSQEMKDLKDRIESMVQQGREPTEAEWQTERDAVQSALDRINRAGDARRNP